MIGRKLFEKMIVSKYNANFNGFCILSLKFGGKSPKKAESGLQGLSLFGCMNFGIWYWDR